MAAATLRDRAAAALVYAGNPSLSIENRRGHADVAIETILIIAEAEHERNGEPAAKANSAAHHELGATSQALAQEFERYKARVERHIGTLIEIAKLQGFGEFDRAEKLIAALEAERG